MPKRVAINISLPDDAFKQLVIDTSFNRGVTPSEEFVALYKRLAKRDLSPSSSSHE